MVTFHVFPINDLEEHDTENYTCKCQPRIEYDQESEAITVIHNSFDGRELVEEAKRILANE